MKKAIIILTISLLVLVSLTGYQYAKFNDGLLRITVCNVGQGDAIFIKTPGNQAILIDAGPDQSVLNCLNDNLPFYMRRIDLFILTHPHTDHYLGFFDIIRHYTVGKVAGEPVKNHTTEFQAFEKALIDKKIAYQSIYANDQFDTKDGFTLKVLGPSKDFLNSTSPDGFIAESGEFASLILEIKFGEFDMITTGDTQANQLWQNTQMFNNSLEVLQVPHHGSRTGLTADILKRLTPKYAVISVGKNRYGHPSPATLNLLDKFKILHLQTNKDGAIKIVTNGSTFKVTPN